MKLQIVPAGPLLNVPRPTLDPESDCVLVRSEVCFTPADLWAPRPRLARLAEVCKAMPKVLAYARLEGMRQTWAKLKAKRLAQGCALGEAAFSVAGSVEQTGERAAGLSPGDRVAACGFGQAACAGYYVVKEEQCTLLQGPAEKEWTVGVLVGSWLYHVLKRARRDGYRTVVAPAGASVRPLVAFACSATGLALTAPGEGPSTDGPALFIAQNALQCRHYVRRMQVRKRDVALIDFCRAMGPCEDFHSLLRIPEPGTTIVSPYSPGGLDWPAGLTRRQRDEWVACVRERGALHIPKESLEVCVPSPAPRSMVPGGKGSTVRRAATLGVSFLGAGNFARAILIPGVVRDRRVVLRGIIDRDPALAARTAQVFSAGYAATDYTEVLDDEKTDAVFIATSHASHAQLAVKALEAGKKVFLEKPPAVNRAQLQLLVRSLEETGGFLAVGYNRRYADHTKRALEAISEEDGPTVVNCSVRLWPLPQGHWYYWPDQGGRVIANACHWIDLGYVSVGRQPASDCLVATSQRGRYDEDLTLVFTFPDGSLVTIGLTPRGNAFLGGRERIEIERGEVSVLIDDYTESVVYAGRRCRRLKTKRDRGHSALLRRVLDAMIQGDRSLYPVRDLQETSAMIYRADEEALAAARRLPPPAADGAPEGRSGKRRRVETGSASPEGNR